MDGACLICIAIGFLLGGLSGVVLVALLLAARDEPRKPGGERQTHDD